MNDIHEAESQHEHPHHKPFWRTRYGIGFIAFGAITAYFLLTEHLAHVEGVLPLLLLLACPLMHVFMHHGHGHHHNGESPPKNGIKESAPSQSGDAS